MEKSERAYKSSSISEEEPPSRVETKRSPSGAEESCTNQTSTSSDSVDPDSSASGDLPSSEQSRGSSPSDDKLEEEDNLLQRKWEEMFARLEKYKEKNGNCLVPNRFREDTQLGNWVSTQRRQYKILQEGCLDSTPMTQARAQKLESIGFKWSTKDPRHVPWMTRYQELVDFRDKYGHSQVPIGWSENIQLSNWVSTQRQEYKLLQKGRSSRLTNERMGLLKKVEFIWEAQRGGPRRRRKATVQVPPKANPVEGVGPRAVKRPAYGTTTPQAAVVEGFDQGFPMIPNNNATNTTTANNSNSNNFGHNNIGNDNINDANANANTDANVNNALAVTLGVLLVQLLQQNMATPGPPQMPWHLMQQGGIYQAPAPLPPNVVPPMATEQYTQLLVALAALASASATGSQNNPSPAPAIPEQQTPQFQFKSVQSVVAPATAPQSNLVPALLAAFQQNPQLQFQPVQPTTVSFGQHQSSSPKTVSCESDQRDSDQRTSENGDTGSSDDSPSD